MEMTHDGFVVFSLFNPDFTTVKNAVERINETFGPIAESVDGSTFRVRVPPDKTNDVVGFIGELEQLEIEVDVPAKVVIDEKTGTIVVGGNVEVLPVSIAHGNIEVAVAQGAAVSQPPPFSGGSTAVVPQTTTQVKEERSPFFTVGKVSDVVEALKKIGAKPTDIVAIFRALEAAGALQGRLEVI
jgi:flagellar P-ring protein precursor FlgI